MIKKLKHFIEFYSLVIFAFLIRMVPLSLARFKARRLADFAFYVLEIRKNVLLENLTAAFPEKKPAELKIIARNTFRQFATTMVELLFCPKWSEEDLRKMVSMEGTNLLEEALSKGKGVVLVGAHFGNWELMGYRIACDFPLSFVVGRQKNTRVDDLLNSYRTAKNVKLIPIKIALRGVLQVLKDNEFIAILSDQDAHELGTFVDFFGRPASTPKAPAAFALKVGCPIIFGSIIRKDGGFVVRFDPVPRPEPAGDQEKDIQNYTQAYTSILEGYVRRYPDHWFWLHRRWKTQPNAPLTKQR